MLEYWQYSIVKMPVPPIEQYWQNVFFFLQVAWETARHLADYILVWTTRHAGIMGMFEYLIGSSP